MRKEKRHVSMAAEKNKQNLWKSDGRHGRSVVAAGATAASSAGGGL